MLPNPCKTLTSVCIFSDQFSMHSTVVLRKRIDRELLRVAFFSFYLMALSFDLLVMV